MCGVSGVEQVWVRNGAFTIHQRCQHFELCKRQNNFVMLMLLYVDGITVDVNGSTHHFYGTVLLCLADTLGAHQLGGFKVGVGFSLRICRDCMATKEKIQEKV